MKRRRVWSKRRGSGVHEYTLHIVLHGLLQEVRSTTGVFRRAVLEPASRFLAGMCEKEKGVLDRSCGRSSAASLAWDFGPALQ